MNDTQKFSEHIDNLQWDSGISDDVLKTVVSFFAPAEETPRRLKNSRQTGSGAKTTDPSKSPSSGMIFSFARSKIITSPLVVVLNQLGYLESFSAREICSQI